MVDLDLTKRFKINPKLLLSFADEDFVGIGIVNQAESLLILPKSESITALYYFFTWNTIENALNFFPSDNHETFMGIWRQLIESHFLITEQETYANESFSHDLILQEKHLLDGAAVPFISDGILLDHIQTVVDDHSRVFINGVDLHAIASKTKEFGAQQVVHVPMSFEVKGLHNSDTLLTFNTKPQKISSICFSESFNLFITNLFGVDILNYKVLENLIYAKKNFLESQCTYLPDTLDIKVFGFNSRSYKPFYEESFELDSLYNLQFSSYRKFLKDYIVGYYSHLSNAKYDLLTEIKTLVSIDFKNLTTPIIDQEGSIKIIKDGYLTNLCMFFEAQYQGNTIMTNTPFNNPVAPLQRCFYFVHPRTVRAHHTLNLKFKYDGHLSLLYTSISS